MRTTLKDFVTIKQAAEIMGVNERHVRTLAETLGGVNVGHGWLIPRKNVEKWERHPTRGRPKSNGNNNLYRE